MDAKKLQFADDVIHIIRDLCSVVFNIQSEDQLNKVFGITHEQLETVIKKIINALPDHMFYQLYPKILNEVKNICAREFIFFQVQERWNDPHYQEDLSNFICIFSRDIQQKISTYET